MTANQRRWISLVLLCLGQLMIVLDSTVVNVALRSIQRELHVGSASLGWVVNAYLIAFGSFLLLAGRLGDLRGKRGVFLTGLAVFTFASLVCGIAESAPVLIVGRFVQGLGGALTSSVIIAIIATEFPDPRERAHALGVYTFVAIAGGSLGLVAGGVLVQLLSWHWIFFINLPIGGLTIALSMRFVLATPAAHGEGSLDVAGAALLTVALLCVTYTIVKASGYGWLSARTLVLAGAGAGLLAAFCALEARVPNPLLPLRIFRARTLASVTLIRACLLAALYGNFFDLALYFERVRGYGALQTGLAFIPQTVLIGALALGVTARVVNRFGPQAPLTVGIVLLTAGLGLIARVPAHGSYSRDILPPLLLIGLGSGLTFLPLSSLAMSTVEPSAFGLASALIAVSQQIGGALGVAVLSSVAAARTAHLLGAGIPYAIAQTNGFRDAFLVGAAASLLALLISFGIAPARTRLQVDVSQATLD
jgi:EmrB/QacA subfamily drug resistance transporter